MANTTFEFDRSIERTASEMRGLIESARAEWNKVRRKIAEAEADYATAEDRFRVAMNDYSAATAALREAVNEEGADAARKRVAAARKTAQGLQDKLTALRQYVAELGSAAEPRADHLRAIMALAAATHPGIWNEYVQRDANETAAADRARHQEEDQRALAARDAMRRLYKKPTADTLLALGKLVKRPAASVRPDESQVLVRLACSNSRGFEAGDVVELDALTAVRMAERGAEIISAVGELVAAVAE